MAIGNSDSNTRFFDGWMAEVIFFNRALSTTEREAVERYLADRYALPRSSAGSGPELHTDFSLDADGETLTLTRPDMSLSDRVDVPAVPTDTSYGRSPDGTGGLAYFAAPTPGAANAATAYGPPVDKPGFSFKRGIYDAPFDLALSHADPEVSIYYTVDGSEPSPTGGVLYAAPIAIANTTIVRAMASKAGSVPYRAIATHTYLFPDDVLRQAERPDGYPAAWGGFTNTSYGLSANVLSEEGSTSALRAALRALPVLSIAASAGDLFGTGGVYANPTVDGFERAVSAEWLTNGVGVQVQADAGLRVQGAASRDFNNTPKKSLRLLFKDRYGPSRLDAAVLREGGGTPQASFNTLILRADYNNSWLHWDGTQRLRGTSIRDQWVRDTQIAMSGTGSHGNHVHLFLNGLYWGVYNVSERPDAAFASDYLGGAREEYDAMTQDGVRDGDSVAWGALLAVAQGGLASQAQYEAIKEYLDVAQFADYMIANIYGANQDWPANNWTALRRRAPGAGFMFCCWDGERTLEATNLNSTGVSGSLTVAPNPASLYSALRASPEFQLLFADRLHRHLFNGGALTPAAAAARYAARAGEVEAGAFGEVARWGAYRNEIYDRGGPSPRYGMAHWSNECARLINAYFPVRAGIVLNQFKAANLYPSVDAPEFSQHGGVMEYGASLSFTNAPGPVYVAFDGSDPRVPYTGAVASKAVLVTEAFAVTNAGVIKARALTNGVWSALSEAMFGVVVSEPRFLPAGDGDWEVATNWLGGVVPQGMASRVRIATPAADRNVNVCAPLTVGQIVFDHAGNAFRNRVRDRGTGNTVTFNGGLSNACIAVTGGGCGYSEFDVAAGVILQTDLTLDIENLEGDPDYGALRLRGNWSGPGGLRKRGAGVASLTGDTKRFSGAVAIDEGVLSVTGPAAPGQAAGVAVASGGQLRLTSASSAGEPRVYAFGGTVTLSGQGRGAEVAGGAGQGKLGALRYDPGSQSNVCVVATPVALYGEADVHVDGSLNRLELSGGMGRGSRLIKTGGGLLVLPAGVALTAAVDVANGALAFAGPAAVGPLSGAGAVRLDGQVVASPSVGGVSIEAVLRQIGRASCRERV